jgi:hypothetical protein
MDLENVSTEKLEKELSKRKDRDFGRCPNCRGKWTMYMGCSRSWREELHCYGCRKPVENCTC